jgi:glycosyltransferase involved in cell wall biosynthesis
MDSPTVTVAIPSSGRWALLDRTLRSVLAQGDVDLEVVVALDTRDRPPPTLRCLADRRVRVTRARRRGLSRARNHAIGSAAGQWIAFLDDDDLWAPTKLARQLGAAGAGAGFVYGAALTVDEELRPIEWLGAPDPDELARELLTHNAIPAGASNVVVRSDVLRDCGGFDTRFSHLADWDLWLRLTASAHGALVSDALVAHVQHRGSMLYRKGDPHREFKRLARKHAAYATALGGHFDDDRLLTWLRDRYGAPAPRRARRARAPVHATSDPGGGPESPAWLTHYASPAPASDRASR